MQRPKPTSPLIPVTERPPAVMLRGRGSYLWDADGKRYLDFVQGWAVNSLGHCPSEVTEALTAQAKQLLTPSPAYHNRPQLELARRLTQLTGFHQAFFCNSGGEACDTAIKLARRWGQKYRGGAFEVLSTNNGFHGRGFGGIAASGKPGWDRLFPPNLDGFARVPFGDAEAMRRAITDRTAAVLVEPVQGEAGVIVPPADYLSQLRRTTLERDVLLIVDEVQTGMGRTGYLLASSTLQPQADVVVLGKGLGGGVPVAALLANERAACFDIGDLGGTYNGNPLTSRVALAVLETIAAPEFLARVRTTANYLTERLHSLAAHYPDSSVRARGLLAALCLPEPLAGAIRDCCFELGLLVNAPRPNLLRLMPSLRVSPEEIDAMATLLGQALEEVRRLSSQPREAPGTTEIAAPRDCA